HVLDGRVSGFFWLEHFRKFCNALVRHTRNSHMSLRRRAVRIHTRARQNAEQTRLPHQRQSDNSCLHKRSILAHAPSSAACPANFPSPPASNSAGAVRDCERAATSGMLGAPSMTTDKLSLPFDHVAAHEFLSRTDKHLARVIERTGEFQFKLDECESVYESLLEAIAYQSISGKAAATIFARIKALGANGICPTPQEILRARPQTLRKAGLSGAKVLAMKDLAKKTVEGVVPTLPDANKMSDEELVERLISVRGIGAWTVEMFLIFRL